MSAKRDTLFLRINAKLSHALKDQASKAGLSINEYCSTLLDHNLKLKIGSEHEEHGAIVQAARSMFSEKLEGVVLFGSVARGENTEESDLDILIVLESSVAINRSLYSSWDASIGEIAKNLSVHFVHLPLEVESQSGLWCEIALEGVVLYDRCLSVSKFLIKLRHQMIEGSYIASYSHGHRYWKYNKGRATQRDAA